MKTMGDNLTTLDNFDRANEDPLAGGGNWTTRLVAADDIPRLATNTVVNDATDTHASAWWTAADFGPDVEAALSIADGPAGARYIEAIARITNPGGTSPNAWNGYVVRWTATFSGTDVINIYRVANAGFTSIANFSFEGVEVVGNLLGIRCIGPTITAWTKTAAGAWTPRLSVHDTTWTTAGKIGFGLNRSSGNSTGIDNFQGGTIGAQSAVVVI